MNPISVPSEKIKYYRADIERIAPDIIIPDEVISVLISTGVAPADAINQIRSGELSY